MGKITFKNKTNRTIEVLLPFESGQDDATFYPIQPNAEESWNRNGTMVAIIEKNDDSGITMLKVSNGQTYYIE